MENASKALIIAGAILLSILLISLGMMVYTNAKKVANTDAIDELAVNTFNEPLESYFGDKVKGANVRELIKKINTNNKSDNPPVVIEIQASGSDPITTTDATNKIYKVDSAKVGSTYKVTYGSTNGGMSTAGYINQISIKKN